MATRTSSTWDITNLAGARLGIYGRASQDKGGQEKSVTDQIIEGVDWAKARDCIVAETYTADNNKSASRFARKAREDFERLISDVEAGKLDGVWFWELSRSQRRLDVYARLRDLCRENGVFWVVAGRAYDLNNYMDVQALGFSAVMGETESEIISARVKRGKAGGALRGRPSGKLTYGFRRVYDDRGRYVEQLPDDRPREAVGSDGRTHMYTAADVVAEIITRMSEGVTPGTITRSLLERGIPTPEGHPVWHSPTLRKIAMNPAYIGLRVHQGKILEEVGVCWPSPIHTDQQRAQEIFYAAQNVLTSRVRDRVRLGRPRFLLSSLARCGVCRNRMVHAGDHRTRRNDTYKCHVLGCASIGVDVLDTYVEEAVLGYLSRPDVYEELTRAPAEDGVAAAARAEAERLRGDLEMWRQMAESGEADDPVTVNRTIKGLKAKIEEQEGKARNSSVPPVLRGRIGPDARPAWESLDDLEVKRQIIRAVADIRVVRTGKGRARMPVRERVIWRWLVGPDQQSEELTLRAADVPTPRAAAAAEYAALLARVREVFADDLAAGRLPLRKTIMAQMRVGERCAENVRRSLAPDLPGCPPVTRAEKRERSLAQAREVFADDLAAGRLPKIREIQAALNIGDYLARDIRRIFAGLPTQGQNRRSRGKTRTAA
ncbi:recombinase family protein [Actinomadura macra]|uniref:recombinase family protein n=1 Tax=Actinomadura macra TaxID=46164 RepID=UPI000833372B|nr:recombinase family protein [Actinomadura macra]